MPLHLWTWWRCTNVLWLFNITAVIIVIVCKQDCFKICRLIIRHNLCEWCFCVERWSQVSYLYGRCGARYRRLWFAVRSVMLYTSSDFVLLWSCRLCQLIMAALHSRCRHYIFAMWFLLVSSIFFLSSPNLSRRRLDVCHTCRHRVALRKRKGKEEYLYSAFLHQGTHEALRHGSHSFTCKQHHACLSFVAFTRYHHHSNWGSRHPIAAHYSFIDPERMKGW